jgi:8-oxo-dGTP pyrophosphatase MutT (NUDIX family)
VTEAYRQAARVILLDPEDRVLLIRFTVPRLAGNFTFWATPGGGLEDGETPIAGARRELQEELGMDIALEGPVHTAESAFEHHGAVVQNFDTFFVARCAPDAPRLMWFTEEERTVLQGMRWWSAAEMESSDEPIFPPDLASVVRRLSNTEGPKF